jgi:hypothetical protein
VAEVADELYGLTPAEFTAARDDRARQVRAAGQRDEAAAIKKLARPTVSAWLVNQLARAPDRMTRLYALGAELQEAQRTLAGDRLRELSVQRRELINDLLPAASDLAGEAGQPASAAVLEEVRATLEAALADADARAAVQSGRLTKSLAYAGIGEVDLSAALALAAVPKSRPGEGRGRPARGAGAPGETASAGTARAADRSAEGRTQRAADAVRAAQATADEAAAALDEAERAVGGVAEQRQFLRRRISHLERELGEARAADAQLTREAKKAERSKDTAARRLATAKRQLDQARREAGRAE